MHADAIENHEEPKEDEAISEESGDEAAPPDERGRSAIAFAYAPLSEAERIAGVLHEFGGSATPDGVADSLDQKVRSGAFRQKMSAARLFGLLNTRPGRVSLTRLGREVIDPERRERARVEAFLSVPLYRELFQKYEGHLLPSQAGLDNEIASLGVSPKQVSTARQVFHRSAEQAGFFRRGNNRLTRPDVEREVKPATDPPRSSDGRPSAGQSADVLQALWFTLLRDGESWDADRVKEYVDGVRRVFAALGS